MFFKKQKQEQKQNKTKRRKREREFGTCINSSSARPVTQRGAAREDSAQQRVRGRAARSSDPVRPPGPASPGPQAAPARGEARKVQAVVQQRTAGGGLRTQREASPPAAPRPDHAAFRASVHRPPPAKQALPSGAQSVARILEKLMINVNTVCPTPHTSASSGAMFLPATL